MMKVRRRAGWLAGLGLVAGLTLIPGKSIGGEPIKLREDPPPMIGDPDTPGAPMGQLLRRNYLDRLRSRVSIVFVPSRGFVVTIASSPHNIGSKRQGR